MEGWDPPLLSLATSLELVYVNKVNNNFLVLCF